MPISLFFSLVLALLLGMFTYFKPSESSQDSIENVPLFELDSFVIYEISPHKINHFFAGDHAKKFPDYYEATNAKLTNNKRELLESIRADHAIYQEDVINLKGNVHYVRADGLEFRSNEGTYDQKNSFAKTKGAFTITKNQNSVHGTQLYYDLEHDTVDANQIMGIYQLN
jgi:LPS export ABC transporter protein LptC